MTSADPHSDPAESTSAGTGVLEREELRDQVEPGDHERYAHYVKKEKIVASAMSGRPVVALCGKVWVPGRDPKKYPVCPECKKIYEGLTGRGEGDGRGSGRLGGFGRGGRGGSGR